MKKIITIIPFLLVCLIAQSQSKLKFGDISVDDFQQTIYSIDSSAHAIILSDVGESSIEYFEQQGFRLLYEKTIRIKILDKEGLDWANNEVLLYKQGSTEESFTNLKGYTYNLVNGKVEKTKLDDNNKFKTQFDKYHNKVSFTMPNVKAGSIIEYKYNITSDFLFNLRSWFFQRTIPVLYSQYTTSIPDFLNYHSTYLGHVPISDMSSKTANKQMRFQNSGLTQQTITYVENSKTWIFKNVPALKEEPYLATIENFVTQMFFELSYIQYPNDMPEKYTLSWADVNTRLLESSDLGGELKSGFMKDETLALITDKTTPMKKMQAIYDYVQKRMTWNSENNKYANTSLKDAYNAKQGNSADINLLLVLMFREAGLDANPVVLSTRSNGLILDMPPTMSRFNYVIARVVIDNIEYLLDATDKNLPMGSLPIKCLNGKGRMLSKTVSDWVVLKPRESLKTLRMYDLQITPDNTFTGKMSSLYSGYAALDIRDNLKSAGSQDEYIKQKQDKHNGLEIVKYTFSSIDTLQNPVKEELEINISNQVESAGNMLYFNPLLFDVQKDNPFTAEKREYPIDFAYPIDETIVVKIAIPVGYAVESVPQPTNITIPNSGGRFMYSVTQTDQYIQITNKLSIVRPVFIPDEYQGLKDFFANIVTKNAEQIVLKKM